MAAAIERSGSVIADVEILRLHYARRCAPGASASVANWDTRPTGRYDEALLPDVGVLSRCLRDGVPLSDLVVFQVQLAKRIDALPITRDYMFAEERRLLAATRPACPHGRAWPGE